jgi:catechol 2,3-dioxygenase-like lactoylglutathione lyase family enzyme
MAKQLSLVSLIVADYDEAIAFYTEKLGFDLIEDTPMGDKRWVVVQPKGTAGSGILLAKANGQEQTDLIGKQGAGRVWLFLTTDDFWADYLHMQRGGVEFLEQPRVESYATVVVFCDLYGNKWDLLQRNVK